MSRFRKILVYVEDGDAESLESVVHLAERHDATVTVCDVINPPAGLPDPNGVIARLSSLSWQQALERLRVLTAPYRTRVALDYTVLTGIPFLAITEQAIRQTADLVVHISEPPDSDAAPSLNPTGMHLVRKCPCTVWIQHPGATRAPVNMVLSVDRDAAGVNRQTESLTRELASVAASVAPAEATLHVVHAWQPFGETLLDLDQAGLSKKEAESYIENLEQDFKNWLHDLTERLGEQAPSLSLKPHLVRGPVTSAITEVADNTNAELIVMGTVGTSAVPGVLIGTSAEAILLSTRTPILALKPRGFTTPLQFPAISDNQGAVSTPSPQA